MAVVTFPASGDLALPAAAAPPAFFPAASFPDLSRGPEFAFEAATPGVLARLVDAFFPEFAAPDLSFRECAVERDVAPWPEGKAGELAVEFGMLGRPPGVKTEALGSSVLPDAASEGLPARLETEAAATRALSLELPMILSRAARSAGERSGSTLSTSDTFSNAAKASLNASRRATLSLWYAAISASCSLICFSMSPMSLERQSH